MEQQIDVSLSLLPLSLSLKSIFILFFIKILIYLFIERGERKEKERDINVWLPLMHPLVGTCPATKHVPCLGIKSVTLWFTACTQSTELHQPGLKSVLKKSATGYPVTEDQMESLQISTGGVRAL